jgi:ABC-2 type transport system permease protein
MLFKRELIRNLKSFIFTAILCSVMVMYVIAISPSMGADIQKILDVKLPKLFQTAFGMQGLNFQTANGVYSLIFSYIYLFLSIYISVLFSSIVSKELNDKTAEFLFSLPATRLKIFLVKLGAAFLYTVFPVAILFLVSWFSFDVFIKQNYELFPVFLMAVAWLIGGITIGSIAFLLSSFFYKTSTIITLSIGVVMSLYFLQVLISINNKLDNLKYICPFEWFKGSEITQSKELSITYIVIALVVSMLCFLYGIRRFKKMDILI